MDKSSEDYFDMYMINEFEHIALRILRLPKLSGESPFHETLFSENRVVDKCVLRSPSGGAGHRYRFQAMSLS